MKLETRIVSLFAVETPDELRMGGEDQPNRFIGLIPYSRLSADLGGWKERINPTAFRSSLSAQNDIRALVDHASDKLLGRTSSGTLRLTDTPKGLAVEIDSPDTSYARDTRELVRRGDIRGLSFGFRIRDKNSHRIIREEGIVIRELLDVNLAEVSVCTKPAYPDTLLALRSDDIDPEFLLEIRAAENNSTPRLSKSRSALLITLARG